MTRNKQTIEVVTISQERRRRWSADEKAALVRETYEPGMTVSLVARKHAPGIGPVTQQLRCTLRGRLGKVHRGLPKKLLPASGFPGAVARIQIARCDGVIA